MILFCSEHNYFQKKYEGILKKLNFNKLKTNLIPIMGQCFLGNRNFEKDERFHKEICGRSSAGGYFESNFFLEEKTLQRSIPINLKNNESILSHYLLIF